MPESPPSALDVSAAASPVRPGTLVANRYRVERTLGAGGMGVVVAATQLDLDRPVALKFLQPKALSRPEIVARFAREARAAAKLQSEHVTRVVDVGALEDGAPFIVMEYLDGEDMAKVLRARGPLPFQEAARCLIEASDAVAEAHALGIIHRDLKPSNLFLARRPGRSSIIKVLDFGISKLGESESHQTSDSTILGSPAYMSPEQLLSARSVDARSDVWSLGIVLYELLTGKPPFQRERMVELLADVLHGVAPPVGSLRPDLPPGLPEIVHRCLEKEPARRFPTVSQLATALVPFAQADDLQHAATIPDERNDSGLRLPLASGATTPTAQSLPPGTGGSRPSSRRSTGGTIARRAGIPLLLLAAAVLIGTAVRRSGSPARAGGESSATVVETPSPRAAVESSAVAPVATPAAPLAAPPAASVSPASSVANVAPAVAKAVTRPPAPPTAPSARASASAGASRPPPPPPAPSAHDPLSKLQAM